LPNISTRALRSYSCSTTSGAWLIFTGLTATLLLAATDELSIPDLLPGFTVQVGRFFD
jgi:hypothetical protein